MVIYTKTISDYGKLTRLAKEMGFTSLEQYFANWIVQHGTDLLEDDHAEWQSGNATVKQYIEELLEL